VTTTNSGQWSKGEDLAAIAISFEGTMVAIEEMVL
jgi:hypothetical protein